MISRKDECAEAFANSTFELADITLRDLFSLAEMIECQLDRCRLDPQTPLQETMRVSGLEVDWTAQGDLAAARIKVSGHYFDARDVVELNAPKEAFVGSWCDSKNVEPFYKAFMIWLADLSVRPASVVAELADKAFAGVCVDRQPPAVDRRLMKALLKSD